MNTDNDFINIFVTISVGPNPVFTVHGSVGSTDIIVCLYYGFFGGFLPAVLAT